MQNITSWNQMTSIYNAIWMVDSSLKLSDDSGNIGIGNVVLNRNLFALPQFLIDMNQPNCPSAMIMSYNPAWFCHKKYKWIEEISEKNEDIRKDSKTKIETKVVLKKHKQ